MRWHKAVVIIFGCKGLEQPWRYQPRKAQGTSCHAWSVGEEVDTQAKQKPKAHTANAV